MVQAITDFGPHSVKAEPEIWNSLGRMCLDSDDRYGAIQAFRRAKNTEEIEKIVKASLEAGNLEDANLAASKLNRVLTPEELITCGDRLQGKGDFPGALACFQTACSEDRIVGVFRFAMEIADINLAREAAQRIVNPRSRELGLKEVASLCERITESLTADGHEAERRGNFAQAIECHRKANNKSDLRTLGAICFSKREFELAHSAYFHADDQDRARQCELVLTALRFVENEKFVAALEMFMQLGHKELTHETAVTLMKKGVYGAALRGFIFAGSKEEIREIEKKGLAEGTFEIAHKAAEAISESIPKDDLIACGKKALEKGYLASAIPSFLEAENHDGLMLCAGMAVRLRKYEDAAELLRIAGRYGMAA